jgi:hypothetical protein
MPDGFLKGHDLGHEMLQLSQALPYAQSRFQSESRKPGRLMQQQQPMNYLQ